ncbi:hypothetical protein [Massilia horti]|uniref:Uncharacterized protein n=1 Tax=Massilia horti TaxID=2562153 RepID=A0A4Y9T1I5_9BURK|nr:hypothetical protein [Massilia horti]TFW31754.1 hypothetical protein E4O92_12455 [Massilia horti]
MKQYQISQFLTQAQAVTQLAQRIRDTLLSTSPDDLLSQHVVYSLVPDEPLSVFADVLHTRHIVRLEYAKYTLPNGELASARYVDISLIGGNEVTGSILMSIVAPNHLLLPNDENLEFPLGGDDSYQVGRVRNAITQALLGSVIGGLPKWTSGS